MHSDNVAEPLDTVSTTTPHLAASNSSSGYSENYRSLINGSDAFSVQNASAKTNFSGDSLSSDYVDPLTGDLTVLQSDLVLPGRDGFDLKLERIYSSARAESTVFIEFMLSVIKTALKELHTETPSKKKSRTDMICEFLKSNEYITNSDVQTLLSVSSATATRLLSEAVKSGIVVKVRIGSHWGYKKA